MGQVLGFLDGDVPDAALGGFGVLLTKDMAGLLVEGLLVPGLN